MLQYINTTEAPMHVMSERHASVKAQLGLKLCPTIVRAVDTEQYKKLQHSLPGLIYAATAFNLAVTRPCGLGLGKGLQCRPSRLVISQLLPRDMGLAEARHTDVYQRRLSAEMTACTASRQVRLAVRSSLYAVDLTVLCEVRLAKP